MVRGRESDLTICRSWDGPDGQRGREGLLLRVWREEVRAAGVGGTHPQTVRISFPVTVTQWNNLSEVTGSSLVSFT